MRQSRIVIIASLLTAGLLGVYWVATAQDGRTPWPPPPVKLDEVGEVGGSLPLPAPIQPRSNKLPVPTDAKSPAEKKRGPVRKWLSGIMPAVGAETPKTKPGQGGLQLAKYQDGGQDIPPPIPPKLTIPPMASPTMPPAAESEPRPGPVAPPLALPPDLPPIPLPAIPPGPGAPPAMPVADPPRADPIKSVITEPVRQVPMLEPGPPKGAGPGLAKTIPAVESVQPGAAVPGAQPNAGTSGAGKTPAFVIINPRKSDAVFGSAISSPAQPIAAPGTGSPLPDPLPPQPKPSVGSVSRSSQPADHGTSLLGVQTPHLTVEKRGSVMSRPGESASFQIVVRNLGPVAATQVRVEDDLPADAKVLSADPAPQLQGNRAMWLLNALPSGGSAVLSFSLQLGASGSLTHSTSVTVLGTGTVTTAASPPSPPSVTPPPFATAALAVKVVAPASVAVGRLALFEVTYANQSNQRMTGLVLHAVLSPGLRHPVGQSIEADVGDLEPGSSKTVKVEAGAVLPGPQGMQVRLARTGGPEASAQAVLDVVSAATGIAVQLVPATRLFLGKTSDLKLEITNHTGKPIRHLAVVSYLPENVDYVIASDRGNYQPNGRTVNWLVDTLAAGQTHVLQIRVQGKVAGQLAHHVIARADGMSEIKSSAVLAVEGSADLAVALQGENALEVGKEAVYEVRVGNPGSGPNTNVRVELTFAPGILPRNAAGPSPFRVEGQTVVFDSLSMLVPQGQAVYRVTAMGQSPGDRRVRVSVTSDQVRTAATRENSTRIYRD